MSFETDSKLPWLLPAITSCNEKNERLKAMGAESVANYRSAPDCNREILALSDGRGLDQVMDIAGIPGSQSPLHSTRIGDEIGLVGFVSGSGGRGGGAGRHTLAIAQIASIAIGPRTSFEALLSAMAAAEVRPVIDQVFPLAEYREAYRRLQSRNHVGKVNIDLAT